jgi:hypothetical protein
MMLPTGTEYRDAVQSPRATLEEPGLQSCSADLDSRGLPLSWAGGFATVFRLRDPRRRTWALRCFTQHVPDLDGRYRAYADYYRKRAPRGLKASLVEATYLAHGIRVGPHPDSPWWPVVLMAWVEGRSLDQWVAESLGQPAQLAKLQQRLGRLAYYMEAAGFVHGDLQQRNLMIAAGKPILVDYDNIQVPGSPVLVATTHGLPSFRHPLAGEDTPPAMHDRFAFLVLHVGLEALVCAPQLHQRWGAVEGLLFQGVDFRAPGASPLFQALLAQPALCGLATTLAEVCRSPADQVPDLKTFLATVKALPLARAKPVQGAWDPRRLALLEALYQPAPRAEAERQSTCKPSANWPCPPRPGAQGAPTPGRRPRLHRLLLAAALLALTWAAGVGVHTLHARRMPSAPTDRLALLAARRERLIAMIVQLDEDLEGLRTVPDEVRLAVPAPDGKVRSCTVAQLRLDLAAAREKARQALLSCEKVGP